MKRLAVLLALCLLVPCAPPARADLADEVLAPCFIVVDANDPRRVLYEHDADERCYPGSTIKIMTCILTIELCADLDEVVDTPNAAASLGETHSRMGLVRGDSITVRDLLYGLMLASGNDASIALAVHVSGSIEAFAEQMNRKAAELGMASSHFVNASGTYKTDQYSTARDMALLAVYAMQNELFRTIVSTATHTVPPGGARKRAIELVNGNRLVSDPSGEEFFFEEADGVKTGSTEQGGKCLVSSASRDGTRVIAVMLGAVKGGSKNKRTERVFEDSMRLLKRALDEGYTPVTAQTLCPDYTVELSCDGQKLTLVPAWNGETRLIWRAEAEALLADPSRIEVIADAKPPELPVAAGTVCGQAAFCLDGQTLFMLPLQAQSELLPTPAPTAVPILAVTPEPVQEAAAVPASPSPAPGLKLSAPPVNYAVCGVLAALLPLAVAAIVRERRARKTRRGR